MGRIRRAVVAIAAAGAAAFLVGYLPLTLVPEGAILLIIGALLLVLVGGTVVPFLAARAGAESGRGMPVLGVIGLILVTTGGLVLGLTSAGAEFDGFGPIVLILVLVVIGSVIGRASVVLDRT